MNQTKRELRRRLESARTRHNEANDLLFAEIIAITEIIAQSITDPTKPTKPVAVRSPVQCLQCECWIDLDTDHAEGCTAKP